MAMTAGGGQPSEERSHHRAGPAILCSDLPCAGCAHGGRSVGDSLVHARDELDERFIEVTTHRAGKSGAEDVCCPAQDVRLPRIQRRFQRAGETAHAVDVAEELLVWHGGVWVALHMSVAGTHKVERGVVVSPYI